MGRFRLNNLFPRSESFSVVGIVSVCVTLKTKYEQKTKSTFFQNVYCSHLALKYTKGIGKVKQGTESEMQMVRVNVK